MYNVIMKLIQFVLLLQFSLYQYDPLLQAIYQTPTWSQQEPQEEIEQSSDYRNDNPEPEHFSWELGTPDNIPETEVIY